MSVPHEPAPEITPSWPVRTTATANATDPTDPSDPPRAASWRIDTATQRSGDAVDLTIYRPSTLAWMAGFAILMVPLLTLFDVPLARWFATRPLPGEIESAADLSLVFSHGIGVFLLLVGIILMAPRLRWQVPRIAALALGGGSIATLTKLFVLRPRPNTLNLDLATTDSAWLWAFDWDLAQVATFDPHTRSFPSGNIATAAALLVGLWVVLPRGRWLYAIAALGQFLQQLCSGSHFLSDLVGGVAIGLLWGYVCFSQRLLGNLFDKLTPESPRELHRRAMRMSQPRRYAKPSTAPAGGSPEVAAQRDKQAA